MNNIITPWVLLLLFLYTTSRGICQTPERLTQSGDGQFCIIRGEVTDEQNNPLSGYVVSAVSRVDSVTFATKTNHRGEFSLVALHADKWLVRVHAYSTLLAHREITVAGGTAVKANFVIEGTGRISGFLLDSMTQLPVPIDGDIQIGHLAPNAEHVVRIYQGHVSGGCFEFKKLLPGRYVIIDAFKGYVFNMPDVPVITIYPGSHVGGVEVRLKPGASLQGRFVDAENGTPISELIVRVASEKIECVYPDKDFAHETETDAEGRFWLTTPNEARTYYAFSLMALHPHYQAKLLRWEMSPGKSRYDLEDLALKPLLSLQGTVLPASPAHAVDGLVVQVKMHNKSADFFRAAAQPEQTVRTDAEGNFRFSGLYPIEYSLTVSRNHVILAFVEQLNPQQRQLISIRLPKLKTLRGTVVDTQQRPIAAAQLYATRHKETAHGHGALLAIAQTEADGAFQMRVLETMPRLLSLEVAKKGYFSRVYQNVDIGEKPLVVPLEKGVVITGQVILPRDIPSDRYYAVKVFPPNTPMEPVLNPLKLNRPVLSKRFPVTEPTFVLDGLFEEKYILYIVGNGISATGLDVAASVNGKEVLIVADVPTVVLQGQILWADTGQPVRNAVVSRSWYPWELSRYDMSMTLDRFETETDAQGQFAFENLTEGRYELRIRAVQAAFENATDALSGLQTPPMTYRRTLIQKQVEIPACDTAYRIYLGRRDGTPFVTDSTEN